MINLPESVRKQFAAAGRRGGLKGTKADKIKAGKASGLARKQQAKLANSKNKK